MHRITLSGALFMILTYHAVQYKPNICGVDNYINVSLSLSDNTFQNGTFDFQTLDHFSHHFPITISLAMDFLSLVFIKWTN